MTKNWPETGSQVTGIAPGGGGPERMCGGGGGPATPAAGTGRTCPMAAMFVKALLGSAAEADEVEGDGEDGYEGHWMREGGTAA